MRQPWPCLPPRRTGPFFWLLSTLALSGKLRGVGGRAPKAYLLAYEKSQLARRLPAAYVADILAQFNRGTLDAVTASERLQIGRSQLYALRHQWLKSPKGFQPGSSGGDHRESWPREAEDFLCKFVPTCRPLNFALIADELARRFGFVRSRAALAAHLRARLPKLLLASASPGPKPRRRWQCSHIGELYQHDSSPHPWWPGGQYQVLLLTIDDHSRRIMAGAFAADTTWDHFCLLRPSLENPGPPAAMYTDGLSLFGHTSTADRLDTHSQFQRALTALGIAHRVAPDAPAKGKIERRFGYFQRRLVSLLAYEGIRDHDQANALLHEQIAFYNAHRVCRTTGLTPDQAWEKALAEKRSRLGPPPPAKLLDLHLALHCQRRLNSDHTIDFLGRSWPVAASLRKSATIVHHPGRKFYVLAHAPLPSTPNLWPPILAAHAL